MDSPSVGLTLKLAGLTTLIVLMGGLPLAWWMATSRWSGRIVIEAIVALPLVLPPTVLGFYLLLAMGPAGPLGWAWRTTTGRPLAFEFEGILLASVLYNFPFAVQPMKAAIAGVDRRLIEAAWCLGASPLATLMRVVLPLAWPGLLAAAVLTFAHTVGEFGMVLMVGGNRPGHTQTVSILIYDHVQALDYVAAHRAAASLVAFSFAVLAVTYALQNRQGHSR